MENGNNLVNTDRLDALKKEIDAFRAKENAAVKPTDILNNQGDISGHPMVDDRSAGRRNCSGRRYGGDCHHKKEKRSLRRISRSAGKQQ